MKKFLSHLALILCFFSAVMLFTGGAWCIVEGDAFLMGVAFMSAGVFVAERIFTTMIER